MDGVLLGSNERWLSSSSECRLNACGANTFAIASHLTLPLGVSRSSVPCPSREATREYSPLHRFLSRTEVSSTSAVAPATHSASNANMIFRLKSSQHVRVHCSPLCQQQLVRSNTRVITRSRSFASTLDGARELQHVAAWQLHVWDWQRRKNPSRGGHFLSLRNIKFNY